MEKSYGDVYGIFPLGGFDPENINSETKFTGLIELSLLYQKPPKSTCRISRYLGKMAAS
jgi:hypothetical protein